MYNSSLELKNVSYMLRDKETLESSANAQQV